MDTAILEGDAPFGSRIKTARLRISLGGHMNVHLHLKLTLNTSSRAAGWYRGEVGMRLGDAHEEPTKQEAGNATALQ
jgi:hypothetical protein